MNFFYNLNEVYPIVSLFFSVILFLGIFQLGNILCRYQNIKIFFSNLSDINFQKPLISINFLILIIYPIVLVTTLSRYVIIFVSLILLILGIYYIINLNLNNLNNYLKRIAKFNFSLERVLLISTIIGYFLLALSPVNHADSLDYHLGMAINILENGNIKADLNYYHQFLAGAGETIIALGLVFGSEQFGTLIQFSGLLSIVGIIKKNLKNHYFLSLLALTTPVILFLATSPKPQLFPICSNALVFYYFFTQKYNKTFNFFEKFTPIIISSIIIFNSINLKYSFVVSSFIILILILIFAYKTKFVIQAISIVVLLSLFMYFPSIIWKYINFGGSIFQYILNPIPTHIPGLDNFKTYLVNYKRETSPLFLIFPKSLGQITDVLGISSLFLISFFFYNKERIKFFIIIIFYISIVYSLGQPSGRFFIEPVIWSILLFSNYYNNELKKGVRFIFYPQFFFILVCIWYGVFSMTYGNLTKNLKNYMMNKTANGHSLYEWSNSVIEEKDAKIISMHRSISLSKHKILPTDFLGFINLKEKIDNKYLDIFKKENPKYLLTWGSSNNVSIFKKCIKSLKASKKKVGFHATRNPFNRSSSYYDGYLFELKNIKLSNCLD